VGFVTAGDDFMDANTMEKGKFPKHKTYAQSCLVIALVSERL